MNTTKTTTTTRKCLLIIDGKEATDREYARVMGRAATPANDAKAQRDASPYQPKPFSLLR
jgi:hypothetical protein